MHTSLFLRSHSSGQESQMYFFTSFTRVMASISSVPLLLADEMFSILEQTKTSGKGASGWVLVLTLHCSVDP